MKDALPGAEEIRADLDSYREFNAGMISATLDKLHEMGAYYARADRSTTIDTHETAYPYMPPLVGNDKDVEALATYLSSLEGRDGSPR